MQMNVLPKENSCSRYEILGLLLHTPLRSSLAPLLLFRSSTPLLLRRSYYSALSSHRYDVEIDRSIML